MRCEECPPPACRWLRSAYTSASARLARALSPAGWGRCLGDRGDQVRNEVRRVSSGAFRSAASSARHAWSWRCCLESDAVPLDVGVGLVHDLACRGWHGGLAGGNKGEG